MSHPAVPSPGDSAPPAPQQAAPRQWPLLASLVLIAWCFYAWSIFAAGITTARFFGDMPSRSDYLEAGMLLLTTLLIGLASSWLASLHGGRWSLVLLLGPPLMVLPVGIDQLTRTGDSRDPDPGRAIQLTDVFQGSTVLNWLLAAALVAAAVVTLVQRRQRRSGTSRAATPDAV